MNNKLSYNQHANISKKTQENKRCIKKKNKNKKQQLGKKVRQSNKKIKTNNLTIIYVKMSKN
jgi:hypothetical protein